MRAHARGAPPRLDHASGAPGPPPGSGAAASVAARPAALRAHARATAARRAASRARRLPAAPGRWCRGERIRRRGERRRHRGHARGVARHARAGDAATSSQELLALGDRALRVAAARRAASWHASSHRPAERRPPAPRRLRRRRRRPAAAEAGGRPTPKISGGGSCRHSDATARGRAPQAPPRRRAGTTPKPARDALDGAPRLWVALWRRVPGLGRASPPRRSPARGARRRAGRTRRLSGRRRRGGIRDGRLRDGRVERPLRGGGDVPRLRGLDSAGAGEEHVREPPPHLPAVQQRHDVQRGDGERAILRSRVGRVGAPARVRKALLEKLSLHVLIRRRRRRQARG